jgi:coenzyme Q-binding protein COQ10
VSKTSFKKIIHCEKEKLINMVLDIERYPEFVPWCLGAKIHKKNESNDLIELEAELKVGKNFLNENYVSHVLFDKQKNIILVNNLDGPLKYLKNEWKFKTLNTATEVDFFIEFKLKNPIFNMIVNRSFQLGLKKITDAFVERALHLSKT